MDYYARKVIRQIDHATDQIDIDSACKVLIMVLKKKAEYLPVRDGVFIFVRLLKL